jgi:hypothetical protein
MAKANGVPAIENGEMARQSMAILKAAVNNTNQWRPQRLKEMAEESDSAASMACQ